MALVVAIKYSHLLNYGSISYPSFSIPLAKCFCPPVVKSQPWLSISVIEMFQLLYCILEWCLS
jgi:hypothetical protein